MRRACSFLCGNCIGVLSAESTFELEFCVTFMKAFRCNTFSFVSPSLKWCVKMPEKPYLFWSYVFCKKHLPLYSSVHLAGAMTMHQEDPISCSTRKNMALDLAFFPPYNSKQVEIGTAKEEIHVLSFGNLPIFRGKVKNEWLTQPILRKIDFLNGGE